MALSAHCQTNRQNGPILNRLRQSSGNATTEKTDRRRTRTRAALVHAFNELVLENADKEIRVTDIVGKANVGRSTFYEHFTGADDLHMQALSQPMSVLADAVVGRTDVENLVGLLEHFRENRRRAIEALIGRRRRNVTRVMVHLLEQRLTGRISAKKLPRALVVLQLAEAPLALIRNWLMNEVRCSSRELADTIDETSRLVMQGLLADGVPDSRRSDSGYV